MRRVVEQQLSQIGDLIRWIAAEKVAGAKKFPTDKIISSVGNGQGNRDSYNEILPRFTVSGHKKKRKELWADRFATAGYSSIRYLDVCLKETLYSAVEIEAIFLIGKAVAFVVFHHIFHFYTAAAECGHHLVAFVLVDARIVRPLCDEKRATNGIGMQRRRGGFELRAVAFRMAHLFVHHLEH